MSLFDLVTFFVFAQAATTAIPTSAIVSGALSAVLTAPATVGVIRYLDNRKAARERARDAEVEARRQTELAQIEAAKAVALSEAEEATGRIGIQAPIAERFATAEREERKEVQAKLEERERTLRQVDRDLAAAQERVRVLLEDRLEQDRVIKNQANAILALYQQNEQLLAWIREHIARNPGSPPPPPSIDIDIDALTPLPSRVVAIEEIVTSSKDDRRES